jgi:hypothetical protein
MFNPDPMPVEVIRALALGAVLLEPVAGEMTELMAFMSARYVVRSIGNFSSDLSKRRTQDRSVPGDQAC